MYNKEQHNEPRWLTIAAGFDLDCLTQQQSLAVMSLVAMRWVPSHAHMWFEPHAFCAHRVRATTDLACLYKTANLAENARVYNTSGFSREKACMLLCFAELVWMDRFVLDWLRPRSDCGGWWSATPALTERLRLAEYTFG